MKHHRASYFEKTSKGIICKLCPHNCILQNHQTGICRVRKVVDETLLTVNYGKTVALQLDPIEKKPLYHFKPKSDILSIGASSCNFACAFCQNFSISQNLHEGSLVSPHFLVESAKSQQSIGIAYTYTEPTIWFEFVLDCAKYLKEQNLDNILVTNGYINLEPLHELLPYIDAMNIDLKSMDNSFYQKYCNSSLEPVLKTIEKAAGETHIELTSLLITGLNDSDEHIKRLCQFISDIDSNIPLHLSRYFPRYKMSIPETSAETMERAIEIARDLLPYVYAGNIDIASNTYCPSCGNLLIERKRYDTKICLLDGKCSSCGRDFDGVL